jgi:glycosyl-4,4'-diaponeurosporenoate acyltransferase
MGINLSPIWLFIVNVLAWFFFHMFISFLTLQIPDQWLSKRKRCFRSRSWERDGKFWQDVFHVREWKKYLPDGSMFLKDSYDQTHLEGTEIEQIKKFILETKRAELTHWWMIPPAFLFFIWNPLWAGAVMILYALILNIPLIITQRYNRPRLERLYQQKRKK